MTGTAVTDTLVTGAVNAGPAVTGTARRPRPGPARLRPGSARVRAAAAIAILALLAAGCTGHTSSPAGPSISPAVPKSGAPATRASGDPVWIGAPAPGVTDPGANLPITWERQPLVRPGWTEPPRRAAGLLLGFAAPDREHSGLRFIAADSSGTVLWRADRPASCTGYALSVAGGKAVAVLTDLQAAGGRMRTTASGYDLATGALRWGPVPVRGSLQGPGLVFAAPVQAGTMGRPGPRMALDAATGAVVADEESGPGLRIVGEYGGIVVTADRSALHGIDAATGKPLWRADNPAGLEASSPAGADAPDGTALVGSGPRSTATLIDVATGDSLATGVRAAALDPLSGSYLALGEQDLTGIAAHGDGWHQRVPFGSRIAAAGSGLVYVVSGGVGRVYNALTGHPAGAYQPEITARFAVPQGITADGAAVFRIDGRILLAAATR